VLVAVGSVGVLVFGIWLAIDVNAYHPWDGWIIAALVLWLVMGALGSRTGKVYNAARDRARALAREGPDAPSPELRALIQDRRALWLHVAGLVTVVLLLVDMIFKPGA
jgi:glycerol uptake facilitator-like aquaporin